MRASFADHLNAVRPGRGTNGKFSSGQLKETEAFFHKTSEGNAKAQSLQIESIINDRWAGRSK